MVGGGETLRDVTIYLTRAGSILVRIGAYIAIVYGIFFLGRLVQFIDLKPDLILKSESISLLISIAISFICAATLLEFVGSHIIEKKYQLAAITSIIVGYILLLFAVVSGIFVIVGGFLILLSTELLWHSRIKEGE